MNKASTVVEEVKKPIVPVKLEPKGKLITGGVYMPPFKMRALLEQMKQTSQDNEQHQKFMWEQLRKSINGMVNKVNVSNISNIIMELFSENLMRGKGLLARAIMKA